MENNASKKRQICFALGSIKDLKIQIIAPANIICEDNTFELPVTPHIASRADVHNFVDKFFDMLDLEDQEGCAESAPNDGGAI